MTADSFFQTKTHMGSAGQFQGTLIDKFWLPKSTASDMISQALCSAESARGPSLGVCADP